LSILKLNDTEYLDYHLIEGSLDHPYLVFLHEGLGCQDMWKSFPRDLCRVTGCPGLIYDRLGFGRSSPSTSVRTIEYVHKSALNELPYVIEKLIPGRPFFLIGHSDGGSISLIYGAERPPLLQGIITEAAHVFVESITVAGIRSANEAFAKRELGGLYRYHREKTKRLFRDWADTWLSDWFQSWNIEYLLPSIRCPLLVIQGKEDQYGSEHQVYSIVSKSTGPARPVLVDCCGHTPHREKADMVLAIMSEFIAGIVSGCSRPSQ
jgi:pimeloyl-ACP methyl ester carboxylesterase